MQQLRMIINHLLLEHYSCIQESVKTFISNGSEEVPPRHGWYHQLPLGQWAQFQLESAPNGGLGIG